MTHFLGSRSRLALAAFATLFLAATAAAQSTTRASVDSAGAEADSSSFCGAGALSADGQLVAFESDATNLVAGDTNGATDVFVRDRATGVTTRASVDSSGAEVTDSNDIQGVAISGDGRYVAFSSDGSTFVTGDSNGCFDVFVHDRVTGVTERVSVDSSGVEADADSFDARLSADGAIVVFATYATNLDPSDANGSIDVYAHDRTTGITTRISVGIAGEEPNADCSHPTISADGLIVAYESSADNLVPFDGNATYDIFVHDRTTHVTERASYDSAGAEANGECSDAALSADGWLVVFASDATNLVVGDTNGTSDVFLYDRAFATCVRVSVDATGSEVAGSSDRPAFSGDGRFVAYRSDAATLVAGDANGVSDVFVHEVASGAVARASVDSAGVEGDARSYTSSISDDGRTVAFYSDATNLVAKDGNARKDIFVRETCADATWSNYGVGYAGTNGIPAFTSQSDPVLGAPLTLDLGSSASSASVAFVLFGYADALIPTSKGGDLLVAPAFALVLALPTTGTTIAGTLPDDESACGFELFAQALELDAGAPKGVSFTAGLKLVCGR